MIKIVCFGVRETEVSFFNKINETFGFELKLITAGLSHENVVEAIGAEAIMVRGNCRADHRNLELLKAKGLKIVLTRTVGYDHVDLEAVRSLNLQAANVPGYSPNAISELALTHAMMLLRHTAYTVNQTANKNFLVDSTMFSREVRNCTIGIIGAGKIGVTTATLFKGLGAKVIGYDVYQSETAKEVMAFMTLDEVLANADIISIHMPYIKDVNYHMIDDAFIAKMKKGSILINTARGEIQDIEAIIRGIENQHLGGFGTDVLEGESTLFFKDFTNQTLPNKVHQKLIDLYPKVLVTPHIGSYTDEALTNMIEYSFENAKSFLERNECDNSLLK